MYNENGMIDLLVFVSDAHFGSWVSPKEMCCSVAVFYY